MFFGLSKYIYAYKDLRNNSIFLNSFYLILSSLISSASGFIFWIVIARFYPVADVGIASAIIGILGFISVVSLLGLDIALVRYLPDRGENIRELIDTSYFVVIFVSIFISMAVILIFKYKFLTSNTILFPIIFVLMATLSSLHSLQNQGIFIGLKKNKYSFYQAISSIIRIGFAPLFIFLGALGIIIAYGISLIFAFFIGLIFVKNIIDYYPSPKINKNILFRISKFSFGNYFARIFETLPTFILPSIIVFLLGADANAYFYIAWQISLLLLIISKSLSLSLLAELVNNSSNLKYLLKRSIRLTFALLIPIIIGIILFGKTILFLFGYEYTENAYMILILLTLGSIPFSINTLYVTVYRVRGRISQIVILYGIIGLVTVGGSMLLLNKFGLNSIAINWILANILALIYILIDFYKGKRVNVPMGDY